MSPASRRDGASPARRRAPRGSGARLIKRDGSRGWEGSIVNPRAHLDGEPKRLRFSASSRLSYSQAERLYLDWQDQQHHALTGILLSEVIRCMAARRKKSGNIQDGQHRRILERLSRWEENPRFGPITVADVSADDLATFFAYMKEAAPRRRWGENNQNCAQFWLNVREACDWAIDEGLRIKRNPCFSLKEKPKYRRPEIYTFMPDELPLLVNSFVGSQIEGLVRASLALGWRQGEASAFMDDPRFINLDCDAPYVRVAQSLDIARAVKAGVKTEKGVRYLELGPCQVAELRTQRQRNAVRRAADPAWNPEGLMFPSPGGGIWTQHQIQSEWRSRLGAETRNFKELRSAAATAMLLVGVPDSVVAEVLGHTTTATLSRHYQHLKQRRGKVRSGMAEALFGHLRYLGIPVDLRPPAVAWGVA